MSVPYVVVVASTVAAPAGATWARVTTPAGIRDELRPWLSMTMPPGLRGRTLADADDLLGRPLGRAWLLLGGVLPVEYDAMTLVALEPGRSFHERSSMALLSRWEHERTVTPESSGSCTVRDRLVLVVRRPVRLLPGHARLVTAVVRALFAHRHRRLAAWARRQG